MAYKDPIQQLAAVRRSKARTRAQELDDAKAAKAEKLASAPSYPATPAAALADWTRTRLVVPAGHPNAGKPLELAPFAVDFLEDALEPGIRESLLTCGRKNGKSAILAALILAHYADDGPLRRPGFRIAVASISRENPPSSGCNVSRLPKPRTSRA